MFNGHLVVDFFEIQFNSKQKFDEHDIGHDAKWSRMIEGKSVEGPAQTKVCLNGPHRARL